MRSSTTMDEKEEVGMFMRAVHPGEVLKGELEELGITPTELARQIEVPANRVSQIISGKRSVTGDTALRLGHWFGVDPQFWLNLQAQVRPGAGRQGNGCPDPPSADQARWFGKGRRSRDCMTREGAGMRLGRNRPVFRMKRSRLRTAPKVSERVWEAEQ